MVKAECPGATLSQAWEVHRGASVTFTPTPPHSSRVSCAETSPRRALHAKCTVPRGPLSGPRPFHSAPALVLGLPKRRERIEREAEAEPDRHCPRGVGGLSREDLQPHMKSSSSEENHSLSHFLALRGPAAAPSSSRCTEPKACSSISMCVRG